MSFKELLIRAKAGDNEAKQEMLELYRPLLVKTSLINGCFDEDLYQELCMHLLIFIQKFRI